MGFVVIAFCVLSLGIILPIEAGKSFGRWIIYCINFLAVPNKVGCFRYQTLTTDYTNVTTNSSMSLTTCLSRCSNQGFTNLTLLGIFFLTGISLGWLYAGVAKGDSCACMNSFGKYGEAINPCNSTCVGARVNLYYSLTSG
jgi:hypothetical protein